MAGSVWDWSQTAASNDDADGDINWVEGQPARTVNNSARVMMQRVAQLTSDLSAKTATTGSSGTYALTTASPFTAYADGIVVGFRANHTNASTATLNANGIGAKNIYYNGAVLSGGEIVSGGLFWAVYDSTLNTGAGGWRLADIDPTGMRITPTGGTETRLVQSWVGDTYYNPLMYSGATVTAKIQAAINACEAASGGTVMLPKGEISLASALELREKVTLRGQGEHSTTLKLANGVDQDVIYSKDFYTLTGTNGYSSPDYMAIEDLTIDGNSANQTSGNGLMLYGQQMRLRRIIIQNVKNTGMKTEWAQYGDGPMEGFFSDIIIDTCGYNGWVFQGPHDSDIKSVIVVDAGQATDNTYTGIYAAGGYGSGRFFNSHVWHRSTATNRVAYSVVSGGGNEFTACHFEGGRRLLHHLGTTDRLVGCRLYAPFSAFGGDSFVIFEANNNQHIGCLYEAGDGVTSEDDVFALYFGSTAGNMVTGGQFIGFRDRSPFNFATSAGLNSILACRGYAASGGATSFGGTVNATDEVDYVQDGTVINYRKHASLPGSYANDAAASAGGVPIGGFYRNGSVVQVRVT